MRALTTSLLAALSLASASAPGGSNISDVVTPIAPIAGLPLAKSGQQLPPLSKVQRQQMQPWMKLHAGVGCRSDTPSDYAYRAAAPGIDAGTMAQTIGRAQLSIGASFRSTIKAWKGGRAVMTIAGPADAQVVNLMIKDAPAKGEVMAMSCILAGSPQIPSWLKPWNGR